MCINFDDIDNLIEKAINQIVRENFSLDSARREKSVQDQLATAIADRGIKAPPEKKQTSDEKDKEEDEEIEEVEEEEEGGSLDESKSEDNEMAEKPEEEEAEERPESVTMDLSETRSFGASMVNLKKSKSLKGNGDTTKDGSDNSKNLADDFE